MLRRIRKLRHLRTYALIALLLIFGGVAYGFKYHADHSPKKIVEVGTPVAAPKSTNSSVVPVKTPVDNSSDAAASRNSGVVSDTQGSASASTDSSQWTSSASGVITVKQPTANSKLKSGDTVAGSAKVDSVNYRLKDNTVGVLAQGTLDVVNGNFSGTLHFQPQGTGGQLDIFSTDSQGVEYNEIQINVSF